MAVETLILSCQLCKHLMLVTTDMGSSAWSLFKGLLRGTSFLPVGNSTRWSVWWQCPVVLPPCLVMLVIYSHIYIFLLNDVFKVVDGAVAVLSPVNPAELCLSFPQGGQCCLPVRPGNCGAGALRAGAKAGRGDFPCGRTLWIAGRVGCCAQTPQPTHFCHCKFPFTYKVLHFGSFCHSCFQKAWVSGGSPADTAYAGDRDYLIPWPWCLRARGCLAGLRKNVGRPFQSKRDLMLCFEIIYCRKSLALKKPQDKFSDSTVIMQIEMYCWFKEETLGSFFGVHFASDLCYNWINKNWLHLSSPGSWIWKLPCIATVLKGWPPNWRPSLQQSSLLWR